MKKKLHSFEIEQLNLRKPSESNDPHVKSFLFAKYFPKYQKQFLLTTKNATIKSKIKKAKVIQNLQLSLKFRNRSHWRELLVTKMKSVKTFTNSSETPKQFYEKLKFFTGLKSAEILMFLLTRSTLDKRQQFYLSKLLKNFGSLRSLEHLRISSISKEFRKYMPTLNSHQRLLASLKTLRFYFSWENTSNDEIFQLIEENKNLLKNVTRLRLSTLCSPSHFEAFQRLGELCSRISNLSFEISCREAIYHMFLPRRFADERFEVETNYLQTLKAFQNLKVLSLRVADTLTFIRDFACPSSIQALKLDFLDCLSKEILLKIDNTFVESTEKGAVPKVFEENNLFLRFYESFKGFDHLETLELNVNTESPKEDYEYQNYLLQSLLKRISSPLKSLEIYPKALTGKSHQISEIRDSSLPQFVELCENFASTVETLSFGSLDVIPSHFDLSSSCKKFPNLSSIEMRANFCQSKSSNTDVISPLLDNLISLNESICLIRLLIKIDRTAESLLSVLKQINQLQKRGKVKIELKLHLVKSLKFEEIDMNFAEGIKELKNNGECYSKVKRVSLDFLTGPLDSVEYLAFIKLYKERFHSEC